MVTTNIVDGMLPE